MFYLKFSKLLIALLIVVVLGSCSYAEIIYTASDYSNSTIGVIKDNKASTKNSFADGDPRIIPFNDGVPKLAVALRGTLGSLSIYDQNDLSMPLDQTQKKIGASINSGVFYKGSLFVADMGDMMSNKGNAKLFKLDEKCEIKNELNLQTSSDEYKFYAEKIIEKDGFLFVLMQRRKSLGNERPYVDHKYGELLKIDPDTLEIKQRWTLNKNPMDMVSLQQNIYVVSIGGAQGVSDNIPKLQVINIFTEAISEIPLWDNGAIPSTLDEPQKITADQSSGEIYVSVSGVTDPVAYTTDSAIYNLNPNDISSLKELVYSSNGSITCLEYDSSDATIMTLFSDYSTYEGRIRIYAKDGTLKKTYSSLELGGSAYQAVLSNSGGGEVTAPGGGGCNTGLPFFVIFMLVPVLFASHSGHKSKG